MATIGHVAVGFAAARIHTPRGAEWRVHVAAFVLLAGLSLMPDVDVVSFALRIPYEAPWGHRGATHSLAFALFFGVAWGGLFPLAGRRRATTMLTVSLVVASHGLLDALTDGGLGARCCGRFH